MWKDIATKLSRRRVPMWAMVLLLAVLVTLAYLYEHSSQSSVRISEDDRTADVSEEEDRMAGLPEEDKESVALFAEALKAVREDYVDQEAIDPKKETYGAIKGMLDSLGDERHMRFLTPDEVEKTRKALSNKSIETGVRLENKNDEVIVLDPLNGSPAEEAGIESGDVLIAVNGESVRGKNIVWATEKLKGPEGSWVDLTVLRGGEELRFSLERVEMVVPAAAWNLISGTSVAHLRLALFSENSAAEFERAIAEAQEAGAQRFVLDLRNNSGGKVDQAEEVAAQFLPAGSVIYIRKGTDEEEEEETVPEGNEPLDTPLVVLVNEKSASSAEIVAAALRDNNRAKVVGETTFGTGTVLDDYVLSDGSAILLAIAEWLTPNGEPIRDTGIAPDVETELVEDQKPRTPDEVRGLSREEIFEEDAQLKRAFEVLQEE